MIRVDIPPSFVVWAKKRSEQMGALKNSITSGDGNIAGFLGEALVLRIYGGILQDTYDCDAIINHRTADIKTKRCTSEPRMNYECTVAATSTHQRCDDYYFARVLSDFSVGWLLGHIPQRLFIEHARFYEKDDPDPAKPSWPFKADCYNMTVQEIQRLGGYLPAKMSRV